MLLNESESIMGEVCPRLSPGASLLIARGDEVLLHQGFGWADPESQVEALPGSSYLIASVTKQFVCVAGLLLVADGLLDLDEPIQNYAPELPPFKKIVTPRHLMTHTSGIKDYFTDDFISEYCQDDSPELNQDKLVEYICLNLAELKFTPGSQWEYSNSAYILLGWIIERISGQPLAELLRKRVFDPLGMHHTLMGVDDRRPSGMAPGHLKQSDASFAPAPYNRTVVGWADGNIISTCADLLTWQRAWQAGEVLPSKLWQEAFSNYRLTGGEDAPYGLGWFLTSRRGLSERWHTGGTVGYRCRASCFPKQGVSIIMLLNAGHHGIGDINMPFGKLVSGILGDKMHALPGWQALPGSEARAWLGRWSLSAEGESEMLFNIQADGKGRLSAEISLGDEREECALLPQSAGMLWLDNGSDYYLTTNGSGRLTLHNHGRTMALIPKPCAEKQTI